ncbi:hypothetical protein ACSREC_26055, partial [Salmonella enterica]
MIKIKKSLFQYHAKWRLSRNITRLLLARSPPRDHRNRRINPVETPSHRRHPETAEIKKASRYYLLAGDFRLSPTPILSH